MSDATSGAAAGAAAGSVISPGIGTVIGAGLGLVGGLFSGHKQYKIDKARLEWEKEAQKTTWQREDNAVQRRAADLNAAGMNRLLAAGSAAQASAPIHIDAPKYPDLSGIGNPLIAKAQIDMAMAKQTADISQTQAQTKLLQGQLQTVTKQNDLLQRTLDWYRDHPDSAPNIPGISTINAAHAVGDLFDSVGSRIGNWLPTPKVKKMGYDKQFTNAIHYYESLGESHAEAVAKAKRFMDKQTR